MIGAVFLGMRLMRDESRIAPSPTSGRASPEPSRATPASETDEQDAPRTPTAPAPKPDLDAFVGQLRRAESYAIFADIDVPESIRVAIADLRIAEAAGELEARARANDRNANVALARLELACHEGPDPETDAAHAAAAERASKMPAETRERIEASIAARRERVARMPKACAETRFNSAAINQRLRSAAAGGHEASLWQLGNLADTDTARQYWLSAAMLGFVPAQVELAQSLMNENSSGELRERNRLNYWLQAAARGSPRGKLLLGECLVNSCTAQPPDMAGARQALREAAFLGVAYATTTLASIPLGDPAAPTDEDKFVLESFIQRLNDLGCYGADLYPSNAVHISDHLQQLGLGISPSAFAEAQGLADQAWREHGAQARAAWHCE